MLHERTAKTYYDVAELYSSAAKNPTAIGDMSSTHVFVPASAYGSREDAFHRPVDPRPSRSAAPAASAAGVGAAGGAGRGKKRDRRAGGSSGGGHAADYSGEAVGEYLEATAAAAATGYPQAARGYWGGGYPPYYGSSGAWRSERDTSGHHGDERERVVEYSQAPPMYGYSQQPPQQQHYYYGNEAAPWGYGGSGGGGGGGGGSGYPPYAPAGAGGPTAAAGAGAGAHGYGSTPLPGYGSPPVGPYGGSDSRHYAHQQQQRPQAPPVEGVYGQLKVRRRTDG